MGDCFAAPGRRGRRYRAMKDRWGRVHTVRNGSSESPRKIVAWCQENLRGEYAHAENFLVFNFREAEDAVLFKLRFG